MLHELNGFDRLLETLQNGMRFSDNTVKFKGILARQVLYTLIQKVGKLRAQEDSTELERLWQDDANNETAPPTSLP